MHQPQALAPAIEKSSPFRRAFVALLDYGRDLLARVGSGSADVPRRFSRDPAASARRVARTLDWIVALSRTLAGDRTWLIVPSYIFPRFPGRYPSLTAQLRAECGLPPVPPRTEAQKAAAHQRYVRHVFATQPVARIASRLARRLGIAPPAEAWPTDLLALPQTPAAYAQSPSPSPSWGGSGWGTTATPTAPSTARLVDPRPNTTGPP